jgi:hypothetical protein
MDESQIDNPKPAEEDVEDKSWYNENKDAIIDVLGEASVHAVSEFFSYISKAVKKWGK